MTGVLIPTPTEADWLARRREGITASEIAVVMGLSPFDSPFALYHRKRGDLADAEDTMSMRIGRYLETLVCDLFAERYPEFSITGTGRDLYRHPERPWQMATPDRLVSETWFEPVDTDDLIEEVARQIATYDAKTSAGYEGWGEDGSDEIPVYYRCQKLWQMDVAGVRTGYLGCLFLPARTFRVYELTMDADAEADLKVMREEAELFLARIRDGNEPEADWRPATTEALRRLHPSVEDRDVPVRRKPIIQYRAACRAYKQAEERRDAATNRLRVLLGSGHRITDERTGEVIATRQVYDVKEHVRKASHVDKLVPKASKGDQK